MWKFKDLTINGKVVLAPMAGITSEGYRKFMSNFGVDLFYSEMVSNMGLIYENEETNRYVRFEKLNVPTGVQLFGSNPENFAKAALICLNLNPNIAFFDVNMGCPVPKVTNSGAGSALMKNPSLCGDIIRAIKGVTDKPISAKIRLGWDLNSINFMEVIKSLEEAKVDAIAIHPRTRKELYGGTPHYDLVKDLREKMNVPLIISGNIFSLDDALNALEVTKADAIMLARGGLGNPFLATQINHYFLTKERLPSPSIKEQCDYCLCLCRYLIDEFGEDRAIRVFRGIGPKFLSGCRNSKMYRSLMASSITPYKDVKDIIDKVLNEMDEI